MVLWNHRVRGNSRNSLFVSVRYGQNLQKTGLRALGLLEKLFTTEALRHGENLFLLLLFFLPPSPSLRLCVSPVQLFGVILNGDAFPGGVKDLASTAYTAAPREIPPRAGESARVRDDSFCGSGGNFLQCWRWPAFWRAVLVRSGFSRNLFWVPGLRPDAFFHVAGLFRPANTKPPSDLKSVEALGPRWRQIYPLSNG